LVAGDRLARRGRLLSVLAPIPSRSLFPPFHTVYELKWRGPDLGRGAWRGWPPSGGNPGELPYQLPGAEFHTPAGDPLSPSARGCSSLDGDKLAGRQIVSTLRALGLEFATFGNHAFRRSSNEHLLARFARIGRPPARRRVGGLGLRGSLLVSDKLTDTGWRPPLPPGVNHSLVLRVRGEGGPE